MYMESRRRGVLLEPQRICTLRELFCVFWILQGKNLGTTKKKKSEKNFEDVNVDRNWSLKGYK